VILSGGPESVHEPRRDAARDRSVFDLGVPVLGICYGMQTMAAQLGGRSRATEREYGYAQVRARGHSRLLRDIEDHTSPEGYGLLDVWMSHGDKVESLPPASRHRRDRQCPAGRHRRRGARLLRLQFHPEVTHTRQGSASRALRATRSAAAATCGRRPTSSTTPSPGARTGRRRQVLLGLSGGVDSSVVAALLHRAIGDQLTCVFVDNGLLRLRRGRPGHGHLRPPHGRARDPRRCRGAFLERLAGVEDPEQKRKIIGNTFIEVFDDEAAKLLEASLAGPGHHLPGRHRVRRRQDRQGQVIKSHHNVGGLPEHMKLELVEPLRELFKDEVRKLGLELGLPARDGLPPPLPGARASACASSARCARSTPTPCAWPTHIFIEELRAAGSTTRTSQAFAVFLPVRSVGVVGDNRRYAHVIALRAVETVDFMTARWAHLPYDFSRTGLPAHHQRDQRRLARRLRHHRQAAGDHRVGVTSFFAIRQSVPIPPGAMRAVTAKSPAPILPPRWRQRRSACHRRTSCATGRWDSMRGSCAPTWSSSEPSGC
jgi:GMP synthase (glutamine-hydrolysing)